MTYTTFRNIALAACTCFAVSTYAQNEVGVSIGAAGYEGDLGPFDRKDYLPNMRLSAGIYGRVDVAPLFAVRAFGNFAQVGGDDAGRPSTRVRNLNFVTNIYEFGVSGELYPLGKDGWLPGYLSLGASVYRFNPQTELNGVVYDLQEYNTEGQGLRDAPPEYGLTRFALPVGIGLRYPIGEQFTFGAELNSRVLFFDYLDDVSGFYRSVRDFESFSPDEEAIRVALSDRRNEIRPADQQRDPVTENFIDARGNPQNNDFFYTIQLSIGFRFGDGAFGARGRNRGGSRYDRCYQF